MESQYKDALALYNQCEYEKAYDILSNSSHNMGDKGSRLLEECKKQILQQYLYLINEAEKQKDIAAANRLKATYTEKYGRNILISKPQHDDKFFRHFFLCFAAILALILFIILISLSRL